MPALYQTLFISTSIISVYFWLQVPSLQRFSLQAVAICIFLYFLLAKFNKAKIWFLDKTAVDELSLISIALLLLIGSTGQGESFFFPMIYIYLFFLIFSTSVSTAIIINLELMLFFYALTPNATLALLSQLLSLPILLVFFLFAREKYLEAEIEKKIIAQEEQALEQCQSVVKEQKDLIESLEKT